MEVTKHDLKSIFFTLYQRFTAHTPVVFLYLVSDVFGVGMVSSNQIPQIKLNMVATHENGSHNILGAN